MTIINIITRNLIFIRKAFFTAEIAHNLLIKQLTKLLFCLKDDQYPEVELEHLSVLQFEMYQKKSLLRSAKKTALQQMLNKDLKKATISSVTNPSSPYRLQKDK